MCNKKDEFWNSYIDYCVSKGSTIFTLEDKIPEEKLIDHSKTKSFGYLKIDLNANQKLGKINLYTIRVENYINIPKQPELNKKIFEKKRKIEKVKNKHTNRPKERLLFFHFNQSKIPRCISNNYLYKNLKIGRKNKKYFTKKVFILLHFLARKH